MRSSSQLSKSLSEVIHDKDAISCLKSFLKTQNEVHLIQFWCEADSFHATTMARLQNVTKSSTRKRRSNSYLKSKSEESDLKSSNLSECPKHTDSSRNELCSSVNDDDNFSRSKAVVQSHSADDITNKTDINWKSVESPTNFVDLENKCETPHSLDSSKQQNANETSPASCSPHGAKSETNSQNLPCQPIGEESIKCPDSSIVQSTEESVNDSIGKISSSSSQEDLASKLRKSECF